MTDSERREHDDDTHEHARRQDADASTGTTSAPTTRRAPSRLRVPQPAPVVPAPLSMGDDAGTPGGIRLTSRYVERDGRPWFPVMGEYHFSRDRPDRWDEELHKLASGGVNVVATYLLWIVHEERRGDLRFDGFRDLRRFVQAAARAGLDVVVRIGPWAHGETRNGGFPDWLQSLPVAHRTNDPAYLDLVRGWYAAIAGQLQGLFRSAEEPTAPVVGIQVDNELYDQPDHLRTLRELAEEAGMRAPLWVATGWGGAQLPAGVLLPVYAGYSDGFWESSTTGWPDFGAMHFTFSSVRDDLSVGADLRDAPAGVEEDGAVLGAEDPWPFVTCELGGGMQVAYHRRPLVDPDDVAALALTKLGSGSAWQGFYLYHGATQVLGERSTTQESHATGYPNDLPVRSYDFYAPVGAEGQQRPHYHQLRRQHLFLEAFGETLATCPSILPAEGTSDVRWAVRADDDAGYLFVNNHQPALGALPDVEDVQFVVDLGGRTLTLPSETFTLRSGTYGMWPLRQHVGTIPALTATAQLITQVVTSDATVVFFAALDGVPVELQLEGVDAGDVSGARVIRSGPLLTATPDEQPGLSCEVRVGDTVLVFLDRGSADSLWRGEIEGRDSVVVWAGSGWFDGAFQVVEPASEQRLAVHPPLVGDDLDLSTGPGSFFSHYVVPGGDVVRELPRPVVEEVSLVPTRTGGPWSRLSAPTDADFATLEPISVAVPDEAFDGVERLLLRLDWIGDALRMYAGDLLVTDQFWSGRELDVDLVPYREAIRIGGLTLRAFGWRPDTEVYVDGRVRPETQVPLLELRSVTLHAVRNRRLA